MYAVWEMAQRLDARQSQDLHLIFGQMRKRINVTYWNERAVRRFLQESKETGFEISRSGKFPNSIATLCFIVAICIAVLP